MPYKDPQKRKECRRRYYENHRDEEIKQAVEWGRNHPDRKLKAKQKWQNKMLKQSRCTSCGKPTVNGQWYCIPHRLYYNAYWSFYTKQKGTGLEIRPICWSKLKRLGLLT